MRVDVETKPRYVPRREIARSWIIGAAMMLALLAMIIFSVLAPQLGSAPFAVAPGVLVAIGLLAYGILPIPAGVVPVVSSATLEARHWWSFAAPRTLLGVVCLTVVVVLGTAGFAILLPNYLGPGGTADTFTLAIAIDVMALMLLVGTWLAVRRIASAPTLPEPAQADIDRSLRITRSRGVLAVCGMVLFTYSGFIVTSIAQLLTTESDARAIDGRPESSLDIAGIAAHLLGAALLLGALSAALTAVVLALRLRRLRQSETQARAGAGAR